MIFFVVTCFAVLPHVRGDAGNVTVEEAITKNASSPDAREGLLPKSATGKVYSDLIKVKDSPGPGKYDTISYSQDVTSDSKVSQTTHPDSKIFILDNGRTYEVGQQPIQSPNPYLNAAIGAVSAHLISQAHEEYIPYPPNGNPHNYPAYRGQEYAESPLAGAYERANRAGYGPYPSQLEQSQPNFGNYPEVPRYYNQPQGCYSGYYSGDAGGVDYEDRSFGGRGRKEPIKRQVFMTSFG